MIWGSVVFVCLLQGCGDGDDGGGAPDARPAADAALPAFDAAPDARPAVQALPATACTPIEYEGTARPELLVASDLPVTGFSALSIRQINNAIRFELRARGWKAGPYHVGFQACDDSVASEGSWTSEKCAANATAYAANPAVVGVVGTFNSGCAGAAIPILNAAPGGGVAMVSMSNTATCLTTMISTCQEGWPASLYPSGTRNYARVVAHDVYQGAVVAERAKALGVTKVYIISNLDDYGVGVAASFRRAALFLGLEVVGSATYDDEEDVTSFAQLMTAVKNSGADGIFVGGFLTDAAAQLLRDKAAVVGPNTGTGAVKLFLPDGFGESILSEATGGAANDAIVSTAGIAPASLTGPAAEFATKFRTDVLGPEDLEHYTVPGLEAARVILDAIARSDGTRASVISEIFKTSVTGGLLGAYTITATGDAVGTGATTFTFYRATADGLEVTTTAAPAPATVAAAFGN
jgi:branched-chain amino acid transport system substrate-binding protein